MLALLLFSLLFTVNDPLGDVQDQLIPAIAAIPDSAVFDIEQITVPDSDTLGFEIAMGSLANPWQLPYGFSFPIIELYLNTQANAEDAQGALLAGSSMLLAAQEQWSYAFRITGDGVRVFRAVNGQGQQQAQDVTQTVNARVRRQENRIMVETDLPMPSDYSLYGQLGSYDPMSETGWRVLYQDGSPVTRPVLEVIAAEPEAQVQALEAGTLPRIFAPQYERRWLLLMWAGLGLMVFCLALALLLGVIGITRRGQRRRVAPAHAAAASGGSVIARQEALQRSTVNEDDAPRRGQRLESFPQDFEDATEGLQDFQGNFRGERLWKPEAQPEHTEATELPTAEGEIPTIALQARSPKPRVVEPTEAERKPAATDSHRLEPVSMDSKQPLPKRSLKQQGKLHKLPKNIKNTLEPATETLKSD